MWIDPWGLSKCDETKVNNRAIINSGLAGKTVNTKGGPVTFDKDGFPDFTPYSIKTVRVDGLTGDMAKDVPKTLEAAGLKAADVDSSYVWHHHQDGKSMMLIPHDVHTVRYGGIGHTGGRAIIKHNINNPNNQLVYPSPPLK